MSRTPPEKLTKRYEDSIHYELDGKTVAEAIEYLRDKADEIKSHFPDVERIALSYDTLEWDSGDGLFITGYAPETDKEQAAREAKEKADKKQRDEYDRREFVRLSNKFK